MRIGLKTITVAAVALVVFSWVQTASADDGVLEFWQCTLRDGKTMEDAAEINGRWLKLQNDANPGAGIRSWALTSIVGDPSGFFYMDAYPTLEAWSKSKSVTQTPEGQALDAEFFALADCEQNRLYQATEH